MRILLDRRGLYPIMMISLTRLPGRWRVRKEYFHFRPRIPRALGRVQYTLERDPRLVPDVEGKIEVPQHDSWRATRKVMWGSTRF